MVSDGLIGEGGGCDRLCLDSLRSRDESGDEEDRENNAESSLGDIHGGSKNPGLSSPTKNAIGRCNNLSDDGYVCCLSSVPFGFGASYHKNYRISVRIVYYGLTVALPTLVAISFGLAVPVGITAGILAIAGDEYVIQPGLKEVDMIQARFDNASHNNQEMLFGREPGSDDRLVGTRDDYAVVETRIGKMYLDLMSKFFPWSP